MLEVQDHLVFRWLWSEKDPSQVKPEEVRDFGGVWGGETHVEDEGEFGMSAVEENGGKLKRTIQSLTRRPYSFISSLIK